MENMEQRISYQGNLDQHLTAQKYKKLDSEDSGDLEPGVQLWDVAGREAHLKKIRQRNDLRRQAHIHGASLLGYRLIMNLCAMLVGFVAAFLFVSQYSDTSLQYASSLQNLMDEIIAGTTKAVTDSVGWAYLLAIAIGYLVLRLWKGRNFFRYEIYSSNQRMTVGAFLTLTCLIFGLQIPAELLYRGMELIYNLFGLSLAGVMESNSMDLNQFPMWLYVCIAGPVTEELIFRGFMLRTARPFSKQFAILSSAIVFGMFHGSPVQTPFAFMVGLVLGYVAMEYHILWAILLHIMNNMLLSDLLPRLFSGLPNGGEGIMWIILGVCLVVAVIMLIVKRDEIIAWVRYDEPMEAWHNKAYWLSPWMIILLVSCALDIGLFLLLPLFV